MRVDKGFRPKIANLKKERLAVSCGHPAGRKSSESLRACTDYRVGLLSNPAACQDRLPRIGQHIQSSPPVISLIRVCPQPYKSDSLVGFDRETIAARNTFLFAFVMVESCGKHCDFVPARD